MCKLERLEAELRAEAKARYHRKQAKVEACKAWADDVVEGLSESSFEAHQALAEALEAKIAQMEKDNG